MVDVLGLVVFHLLREGLDLLVLGLRDRLVRHLDAHLVMRDHQVNKGPIRILRGLLTGGSRLGRGFTPPGGGLKAQGGHQDEDNTRLQ
ncbi:hypothetical protein D3C72_1833930 [compost metagenome]